MTTIKPDGKPFANDEPQLIVRPFPPAADYPVAALGPLGGVVDAVQGMTQAPVAIPAQSALAFASLAVQPFASVETLQGYAACSVFALTIAESGERKSSCDMLIMEALHTFEREAAAAYREERARWCNAHAIWKRQRDKILSEAKSGQKDKRAAAQADFEALGPEPLPPPIPDRIVTEPTYEGLIRLFQEGQSSLGIFSDEGGQFIGGYAMNSDNRQKTVTAINDLWHGKPIRRTRAGEGAYTLYGRRLAVHLMVQPEVVQGLLADSIAKGSGFLARSLVTLPASTIGTRVSTKTRHNSEALEHFKARMLEILRTPMPMDPDTRELKPRHLPLSSSARQLLVTFYDAVEQEQRPGGRLAHIKPFASKAAEHATRIAGVLALVDDLNAPDVSAQAMANGIELAGFYLEEAVRLADAAMISVETAQAEELRVWMFERWPDLARRHDGDPQFITPKDVVQFGPGALREGNVVKRIMAVLEEFGWLVALEPGTVVGGKSRRLAYHIVRD